MADNISKVHTTKLYKRLITFFVIIAVFVLTFIIYFSFSNTKIEFTLNPIEKTTNFTIDIKKDLTEEDKSNDKILTGRVLKTTVEGTKIITNPNKGDKKDAQAIGTVTIYNNWNEVQPLSATTRLLTPGGKLFRIKYRVDVPAGGQLENVEVYADRPGLAGNIGPTKFTIPGLWSGLQDKIYAESSAAMTGGVVEARLVTEEVIAAGEVELKNELIDVAKKEFIESEAAQDIISDKIGQALATTNLETTTSANIGDEAETIDIFIKLEIIGILFDENELLKISEDQLTSELADDKQIHAKSSQTLSYLIQRQDVANESANILVIFTAGTILNDTSLIFDKEKYTDMTTEEINNYLANFEEILSVQVHYSPFWKTTTPTLKDHIEIEIK